MADMWRFFNGITAGQEFEEVDSTIGTVGIRVSWSDRPVYVPRQLLVKVPRPVAKEPEPGPYLVGHAILVKPTGVDEQEWFCPGAIRPDGGVHRGWGAWDWHLARLGLQHDVDVTPLVPRPERPPVELPWGTADLSIRRCEVPGKYQATISLHDESVRLTYPEAREAGFALLAATEADGEVA